MHPLLVKTWLAPADIFAAQSRILARVLAGVSTRVLARVGSGLREVSRSPRPGASTMDSPAEAGGKPENSTPRRASEIDLQVASRLRARRQELGVTQQMLAAAVGLSYQQVQKYETAVNRIGAGRLFCLAQALGVRPSYFFAGLSNGQTQEDRAVTALRGEGTPPVKAEVRRAIIYLLDSLE